LACEDAAEAIAGTAKAAAVKERMSDLRMFMMFSYWIKLTVALGYGIPLGD
jgi:hypothetical protein